MNLRFEIIGKTLLVDLRAKQNKLPVNAQYFF